MLTALLTFTDSADEYQAQRGAPSTSSPLIASPTMNGRDDPPPPPIPTKSVLDRIVMAQAQQDVSQASTPAARRCALDRSTRVPSQMGPNEVLITEDIDTNDYARYGCDLLQVRGCLRLCRHARLTTASQDRNILYIVLKSGGPENVQKVLMVAEGVKRLQHKAGVEEMLHLYPSYNEAAVKGPKVIKLDDPSGGTNYTPPMNLTIHLSKIPMPELQPKPKPSKHGRRPSSPPRMPSHQQRPRRNSQEGPFMADPWAAGSSVRRDGYTSDNGRKDKDKDKGKGKSGKKQHSPSPAPTPNIPLSPQPGRAGKLSKTTTNPSHLHHPQQTHGHAPASGPGFPAPNVVGYVPGPNPYAAAMPRPQSAAPPPPPPAAERPTTMFGRFTKW